MIQIPDHQIDRICENLPTMREIAACVLACCFIWGSLVLIVVEALP
ncbi:hypothetical protein [Komagataeibacter oboediens]|uniref:Uncharacterized protein n=1 Tax=Komagataeibacter oboediens TaxID=65958 RepID=A0ABS5SQS9_9PROT|nr:hypothetical protein [Komagataeibacter oboediens]MBL7233350.1 hypothetical protein [Komagataeibacter oboediens]MBT0676652.1 hypothetical protein [Komagataeibacter oboediens]MBT0678177.1 hypothetical protein [Komagataeibacter oboediens]